jgi:protein gp37
VDGRIVESHRGLRRPYLRAQIKEVMGKTSIEWTDASWNPIVGCTEISPGCANCYAARLAATRLRNTPQYKGLATIHNPGEARWTGEVRNIFGLDHKVLEEPLHWRKPRRIFVCDMGDLFHEDVQDEWLHSVFWTILSCPRHTFQILTKRADRMKEFMTKYYTAKESGLPKPLPNVWLGVSVENQHFADERIPLLLATPAAVRWISAEPLLGPVDLDSERRDGLHALGCGVPDHKCLPMCRGIDWVVCGGESGPGHAGACGNTGARPMHPDWARSLRDQCQAAGVPFFFKQWGEWGPPFGEGPMEHIGPQFMKTESGDWLTKIGKKKAGRLLDGRTWDEFPCASPSTTT